MKAPRFPRLQSVDVLALAALLLLVVLLALVFGGGRAA